MAKKKVLITVTTYPLPSRSYDELVCTAGVLETGEWIRIYPVPLQFLRGLRKNGKIETFKYNWIELELNKRTDDFRPESHSPTNYDFKDIVTLGKIGTESRLMIEDWEIGALYWNCLKGAEGNEKIALEKVREKYEQEFLKEKDIYLFLGTTQEWHMRRAKNPFVIIGVFYPKREIQAKLF